MSSLMPERTADEDMIDACRRHQRAQQHPHLVAVEPAVQDRDVLLLAGDDVEDREAIDEAILELLERLEEHDVVGRAVAVEQEEAAVRLARKHALDDRQDRRDAGARGKADMDACRLSAGGITPKRPVGVITSSSSPHFEFVRCPVRKRAAVDLLHGDAHLAVVRAGADRIGAAHFLAIEHGAEREVLAGRESVVAREFAGTAKVIDTASAASRRRSLTVRRWKRGAAADMINDT